MPTILDSVAEGNTRLLIRLQNKSPLSHEVQIGNQGPRKVRVRHTLGRHWVTPDAFAPSVPHDENRKRVVRCFWLSEEPIVHRDRRNVFCLLCFRINSAVTKRKSSTTDAPQSTHFEMADEKTLRDSPSDTEGKTGTGTCFRFFCLLSHILIKTRTSMFVSATVTGRTDEPAHRLGSTYPQVPVIFCDVCFTTQTGEHVLRSVQKSVSCSDHLARRYQRRL